MKKMTTLIWMLLLTFSLTGCASEDTAANITNDSENSSTVGSAVDSDATGETPSAGSEPSEDNSSSQSEAGNNILIAYFTYGENAELPEDVDASASASIQILDGTITGNTGLIANDIQKSTNGTLFSIHTAEQYAPDYDTVVEQGQAEKNNNVMPEISNHIENFDSYDTVFVGFPNWWYGMPMVMNSFFEEYDFSGKTIIPFCTSGGSAFSDAIDEIRELEPNATVLDGLHIGASSAQGAEDTVAEWVSDLNLAG